MGLGAQLEDRVPHCSKNLFEKRKKMKVQGEGVDCNTGQFFEPSGVIAVISSFFPYFDVPGVIAVILPRTRSVTPTPL